jgi:2-oxoacid:acceptor oxidoreductase delta subunit (pyruvate/2-ketoisovalerate family)
MAEMKITMGAVIEEPGSSVANKTGSWRTGKKPVRDVKKCIKCMRCWLMCPDNAINEKIETDYDYCKGCGICAAECPVKCIEMADEDMDKKCEVQPKINKKLKK